MSNMLAGKQLTNSNCSSLANNSRPSMLIIAGPPAALAAAAAAAADAARSPASACAGCDSPAAAATELTFLCDCRLLLPPVASDPLGFAAAQLMLLLLLCKGRVRAPGAGVRACSLEWLLINTFM